MTNSKKMLDAIKKTGEELLAMPIEELKALIDKHRFHSFMEDVLAGKAEPSDIDDAIEGWHRSMGHHWFTEMSILEWLGMTQEEYSDYVEQKATIEQIVSNRRWVGNERI